MRRRIMTLLLAAALLGSLLPQLTLPVRADASGTCGLNAEWHYDEGSNILIICGTGAMYDWTDASWHWEGVPTSVASIVIEDEITSIGENAFSGCTAAVELTLYNPDCGFPEVLGLPLTATIYGYAGSTAHTYAAQSGYRFVTIDGQNWAFDETTGVLYICTDAGIALWMEEKDNYCSEVVEVHIMEGVTGIPDYTFSFCPLLTEVTIPSSVTAVEQHAFLGSKNLTTFLVDPHNPDFSAEDGVLFDRDRTMLLLCAEGKTGVYSIPNTVTEIGQSAFFDCDGLTQITIPGSVEYLETNSFSGCDSLTAFEVDPQNPVYSSLDGALLSKDQTVLIQLPGGRAGAYTIPDGVTSIADYAFAGNPHLAAVTIPDSVTDIGFGAFCSCYNLISVTIPDSVTSIWDDAFYGCTALKMIRIENPDCMIYGEENTLGDPDITTICGAPGSTAEDYATQYGYRFLPLDAGLAAFIEETGVLLIHNDEEMESWMNDLHDEEVLDLSCIHEAHVLEGVTAIPTEAFSALTNMGEITISSSVASIGSYVFLGCDSLASILVDPENTYFSSEEEALFNHDRTKLILCTEAKLGEFTVPDTVTEIEQQAFIYCDGIWKITIPSSVTYIEDNILYECHSLCSFDVAPENQYYSSVDGVLFNKDQTRLVLFPQGRYEGYEIPDGVTTIGSNSFFDCIGLREVTIPDSVTSIESLAFGNCSSLTELLIPDSVTSIGAAAISNCDNLTDITIPASVTSIGGYAFRYCDNLSTVTILNPDCVIYGGADTMNDPSLTTIIGYYGSTAEAYAQTYGYNFEPLPGPPWEYDEATGTLYVYRDEALTDEGLFAETFYYTGNITTVHFMEGVTHLPPYSIAWHPELTEVTISSTVTDIEDIFCFCGCTGLVSIVVDPDNPSYSSEGCVLFDRDKTELILCAEGVAGTYTVPEGVVSIGDHAFYICEGLTEIVLPESLGSVGELAFDGCSGITSITIPASVASIGEDAFTNCANLAAYLVDPQNACYSSDGGVLFDKDKTYLIHCPPRKTGAYTIPDSVTEIGDRAFAGCSGLTSVTIPDSVTEIGDRVFAGCTGLMSVTIPDSVTDVGRQAFWSCAGLTSVTIPENVTGVGEEAFHFCNNLTSVTILNPGCEIFPGSTTLNDPSITTLHGYAGSTAQAYAEAYGYSFVPLEDPPAQSWYFIEETGLLVICSDEIMVDWTLASNPPWRYTDEDGLIHYYYDIQAVLFLDGVTRIGNNSFYECKLKSVTIPDSVTSIGKGAFMNSGLRSVTIPESVTSIGEYAFEYSMSLSSVTIPEGVTSIGRSAFYGCRSLTSLTIPASVVQIGDEALAKCDRLTSINVASGNLSFSSVDGVLFNKDRTALLACPAGKSGAYQIPDGVTEIGRSAFCGCEKLTDISIPDGVTEIGMGAFANCTYVRSLTIPEGVTEISDNAFWFCSRATSITIPEGVTSIGSNAFTGCQALTSVTIPASVTSIGAFAFDYATSMTEITVLNPDCVIYPRQDTLGDPNITTIYGYAGSTAQAYAETYGYPFVPLEPVGYRVLFDANGGEGEMAAQTIACDAYDDLTANAFYRTGYSFNGWNTEADGSGRPYTNGMRVRNLTDGTEITLYAQWKPRTYIVRYNANGGSGALENQ